MYWKHDLWGKIPEKRWISTLLIEEHKTFQINIFHVLSVRKNRRNRLKNPMSALLKNIHCRAHNVSNQYFPFFCRFQKTSKIVKIYDSLNMISRCSKASINPKHSPRLACSRVVETNNIAYFSWVFFEEWLCAAYFRTN